MSEIVAEVIRNDRVESIHRAHIAIADASGTLTAFLGDPNLRTYMRSAAKPFQIMPFLEDGLEKHFGLTEKEVTVMMASHNGEAAHVRAVEGILEKTGLRETDLRCGFHPPMDDASAKTLISKQTPESALYNNCSGKHSGMLALAKVHGWPLTTYLDPAHQVQQRIKGTVEKFAGARSSDVEVGVDGCSAPVFYLALDKMATMYAKLAQQQLPLTAKVFQLMARYPEMIAGTDRFDTLLMQTMGGRVVSKVGAEGIRCIGVSGKKPLGIALKIEDGSKRASQSIILEILDKLNLISPAQLSALSKFHESRQFNHAGIETGRIAVKFDLQKV